MVRPLKVTFLGFNKEREFQNLQNVFDKVIKKLNYNGKFVYVNANKANYGVEEIEAAYECSDGLECSSYHDLLLTRDIVLRNKTMHPDYLSRPIICNGFKKMDYINEIADLSEKGFNIITIIDNQDEYNTYKNLQLTKKLKVGVRVHLHALYAEEDEVVKNDRFGVTEEEYQYILKDIVNYPMLDFKVYSFPPKRI